jgi:hypothetical protein
MHMELETIQGLSVSLSEALVPSLVSGMGEQMPSTLGGIHFQKAAKVQFHLAMYDQYGT